MEFIKPDIHFDFVGKMKMAFGISMAMIIISLSSVVWHGGLNYGIDFAGGTLVQVKFNVPFTIDKIRDAFRPAEAEIGWARAVLAESEHHGRGVFTFRGRMVDGPVLKHAEGILRRA